MRFRPMRCVGAVWHFREVMVVTEWGKAFEVAFVGLSGVFLGLVLLNICVNVFAQIVRGVERIGVKKDAS